MASKERIVIPNCDNTPECKSREPGGQFILASYRLITNRGTVAGVYCADCIDREYLKLQVSEKRESSHQLGKDRITVE